MYSELWILVPRFVSRTYSVDLPWDILEWEVKDKVLFVKNVPPALIVCLYFVLIMWFYCGTLCLIELIHLVSRKAFNKLDKINCILDCVCVGSWTFILQLSQGSWWSSTRFFSDELNKNESYRRAGKVQVGIDQMLLFFLCRFQCTVAIGSS